MIRSTTDTSPSPRTAASAGAAPGGVAKKPANKAPADVYAGSLGTSRLKPAGKGWLSDEDLKALVPAAAAEVLRLGEQQDAAPDPKGALARLGAECTRLREAGFVGRADLIATRLEEAAGALQADAEMAPLDAMAKRAAEQLRPMLQNGTGKRCGPGIYFYFHRGNQSAALMTLISEIKSQSTQGNTFLASELQRRFEAYLGDV